MPYIEVPAEAVESQREEEVYLTPGRYTGEPRSFGVRMVTNAKGVEVEKLAVDIHAMENGTGPIAGKKTLWLVSNNPSSEANTRIGREGIARLAKALGVLETDETTGQVFVPGETLADTVDVFNTSVAPGTRIGFNVVDRMWLNADKTPYTDPETGEIKTSNEIKSVWATR